MIRVVFSGMVFLRQAVAKLLRQRPAGAVRQAVRRMGGDAHHSPAPHPSQPKQAFLFNEPPGRKVEIWEHVTSVVYWSAFFILVSGLYSSPETRIKEWAAEEAEERLARLDEGKSVEYGKYYHKQLGINGFKNPSAAELDGPPEEIESEDDE